MFSVIIFLLGMSVPSDLYGEVFNEIILYNSKYKNMDVMNTCIVDVTPLSFVYELRGFEGERISLCAQRPWRTNSWMIEECDTMCREFQVSDQNILID